MAGTELSHDRQKQSSSSNPDETRFGFLLIALLLMLILYPFHNETPFALVLFALIDTAVLVAVVTAASHSRQTLIIALVLAAPGVALLWIHTMRGDPLTADLMYAIVALFYGYTIYHVLGSVLRPGAVTSDKIAGAVAVYLLAAVGWAGLYGLVDSLQPGSFMVNGQIHHGPPLPMRELLYFSFTTLTTTGYGDVTPVGGHAQSLVILEQLAGTFYVAILVARLAGLYQPRLEHPHTHSLPWRRHRPGGDGS